MFCIDASVIISAAHGGEADSVRSTAFMETIRKERYRVFLPEIAITEVRKRIHGASARPFAFRSAGWRIGMRKVYSTCKVTSGLFRATKDASFSKLFANTLRAVPNFIYLPVDRQLADNAVGVICKTGLRSADALYVALAHEYHLTLVTLDREQLTRGKIIVPTQLP